MRAGALLRLGEATYLCTDGRRRRNPQLSGTARDQADAVQRHNRRVRVAGTAATRRRPRTIFVKQPSGVCMKSYLGLFIVASAISVLAQGSMPAPAPNGLTAQQLAARAKAYQAPEVPIESVPNFIKLPAGIY